MQRIFLFVPPEEYREVQAAGAAWDDQSKRWYIPHDERSPRFLRWLGDETDDLQYQIVSDHAFVASAPSPCQHCEASIEVICLYCDSGTDLRTNEPLLRFTVSSIGALDENLAAQLARWPNFRQVAGDPDARCFANHCAHCGAEQEDYRLHSEPGDVFFGLSPASPHPVRFIPLAGRICVSGDYSFEV